MRLRSVRGQSWPFRDRYDLLLRPIEERLGARRLVVVPHRALHYIPFHALHDGTGYLIERREVCYAPSASVLRYCFARPRRPLRRATLLGFPDTQVPWVRDEVIALAPLFPEATTLLDDQATLVRAAYPNLSPAKVAERITATAVKINGPVPRRVDAAAALGLPAAPATP